MAEHTVGAQQATPIPQSPACGAGLTLDTRARCVAKPCCRKRALWALPRLYSTTFSTAPKMLSRASDSITVCRGVRDGEKESEIQLLGTELLPGSGVRDQKAQWWGQRSGTCWLKPYLHDDLQCI